MQEHLSIHQCFPYNFMRRDQNLKTIYDVAVKNLIISLLKKDNIFIEQLTG